MAEVHYLRPPTLQPAPDPYSELLKHRTQMISAWVAWLATNPSESDVALEMDGTTRAMRSLADLIAIQQRDLFR